MANNKQSFPTKQETGYADPLSNCTDFNILNFINSSDTPDLPYCPTNNYSTNGNAVHLEQQQPQQRQHQNSNHLQQNAQRQENRQMHSAILENGILYNNGNTQILPDSPPITDISAGASSGSPSSSDSPYSPENYNNYGNTQGIQMHNGNLMTLSIANDNAMHQDVMRSEIGGNIRIQAHQTQVSPNSDFLSPYPVQTPASHHSQVSPPAINPHSQFLMESRPNYPPNAYLIDHDDFNDIALSDCNPPTISRKRQRLPDGSAATIKNESSFASVPASSSTPLPAGMAHQNSIGSMNESTHGESLDEIDDCNSQRTIRFTAFDPHIWTTLYDQEQHELSALKVNVVADKGFNYSTSDNCFVNQKKNHFQITVLIKAINENPPYFVMTSDGMLHEVISFKIAFCGAKSEMTSSEIQIRQSQTDRKPIPHDPVELTIAPLKLTKITVPRLHFSETTMNNHRKNGRPNPDQKFFYLIVRLLAETPAGLIIIQSYASDKVIVRASNPGQFEPPESEATWQRSSNVLHCNGPVAIGTDKAINNAQLTVHGNIVSTGQHTRPSDRRVKENIMDLDTKDAMERIANVRLVEYSYKPEIAAQWGLNEENRHRVGVIAQELAEVLPDAVRRNGEFLTVDDARIFYDTVAAAQELYRLTHSLQFKVNQVEKISQKLARFSQKQKTFGSTASGLSDLTLLLNTIGNQNKITDGINDEKNVDVSVPISQSRLSLNSCAPSVDTSITQIGSASQIGLQRSRQARRNKCQNQSLCNSKLTQITMVSLVVIMSLCLITMCTLYVLDWYHRTYVYTTESFPRISPTTNPMEGIANIITFTNWSPPPQPLVSSLLGTCQLGGCAIYCCTPQSTTNSSMMEIDEPTSGLISAIGSGNSLEIRPDSNDANQQRRRQPLSSNVEIKLLDLNVTLDSRYCVEKSCIPRKGLYTLNIPISPYMPTIPLRLRISVEPGLYVDSCGPLDGFKHKSCEWDANVIQNKGDIAQKSENAFKNGIAPKSGLAPSALKIDDNTFELSAPNHMQSAFQFRVGFSTDSCNMHEGQQGKSFEEYNLVFYRSCII